MTFAPIALFAYARSAHTRLTIEALLKNPEAEFSDLIIYSDAARTPEKQTSVDDVRAYLKTIIGFRSITIYHRPYNFGLAKSIVEGVTEVLKRHDAVIVLEDDLVTSSYFLSYMNQALEKYADDSRVISIHGYVYPVKQSLPEAFFLRGADCWGWATWRRGWRLFNPNGQYLLDRLKKQGLINEFNFNGAYSFSNMLEGQVKGTNDSWAVRWHASAYLADKLTLHPGRSLVNNIGNDASGTHCGESNIHDVSLSDTAIDLSSVEVLPSILGHQAFEQFYRQSQGGMMQRVRHFLAAIFRKIIKSHMLEFIK
ncbi:Glycosyltransferase 2-like [Methylophilaceae bacterium]